MFVENGLDGCIMFFWVFCLVVEMGELDLFRVYFWMCERVDGECILEFFFCCLNLLKYLCRE